jgi:TolB protein
MTTRSFLLCLAAALVLTAVALFGWPGFLRSDGEPTGVIAFQGRDADGYGIFTVSARGGSVRQLPIPLKESIAFPRCSPDGRLLAVIGEDASGKEDLFITDAAGRNPRALSPSPGRREGAPAWAPAGDRIAFASDRDGNWEIYDVRTDGTGLRRLTNDPAQDLAPAYSSDGQRIAFSSDRTADNELHLFVMNADGRGTHQITFGASEAAPDFSPDGKRIAFVSQTNGEADIWIADADGSNAHPVSAEARIFEYTPRWSPDGEWIAYERYGGEYPDVFLIRPDGTGRRRLTDTGSYAGSPSWRSARVR